MDENTQATPQVNFSRVQFNSGSWDYFSSGQEAHPESATLLYAEDGVYTIPAEAFKIEDGEIPNVYFCDVICLTPITEIRMPENIEINPDFQLIVSVQGELTYRMVLPPHNNGSFDQDLWQVWGDGKIHIFTIMVSEDYPPEEPYMELSEYGYECDDPIIN